MKCPVACPACGHEGVYDPEDCWTVVRFTAKGRKAVESTCRRVRCGREEEVPIGTEGGLRGPGGVGMRAQGGLPGPQHRENP
jgi:hypothetical protein